MLDIPQLKKKFNIRTKQTLGDFQTNQGYKKLCNENSSVSTRAEI